MEENNTQAAAPVEAAATPVPEASEVSDVVEGQEEGSEQEASSDESVATDKKETKQEKEIKKNIKKLMLKIDGEDVEEEIDLDDEENLKKHLQMSKVSQKRMQQSAELRKQIEQFVKMAQKSPELALKDLGIDAEEFAYNLLQRKVEESKKSPEVLEKEKLQKELEELRAEQKAREEAQKNADMERIQAETERKLEDGITSALKDSGLPKSAMTVKKMAEWMYVALQNNIDLEPKDVIPLIRKEMKEDLKEFFSISGDDMVEEILGKDRINNMRKKQVAALKERKVVNTLNIKPTGESKKDDKASTEKKVSIDEWLRG